MTDIRRTALACAIACGGFLVASARGQVEPTPPGDSDRRPALRVTSQPIDRAPLELMLDVGRPFDGAVLWINDTAVPDRRQQTRRGTHPGPQRTLARR